MTEATSNTPATPSLYAALAAAQAEFAVVVKNGINPMFKNRYADLSAILAAVKPALNRHGLFLFQKVTSDEAAVIVESIIVNGAGESISSGCLRMPAKMKVDKKTGARELDAQCFGSAETYARRYSLQALLGIAAEDDDDGNGSQQEGGAEPQQQQGYVLTQEVVDIGHKAAAEGTEAFKSWYQAQPIDCQKALTETGWKKALWDESKAAEAKVTAQNESNKE